MELNFLIIFTNKNKKNTIKMSMGFGFLRVMFLKK